MVPICRLLHSVLTGDDWRYSLSAETINHVEVPAEFCFYARVVAEQGKNFMGFLPMSKKQFLLTVNLLLFLPALTSGVTPGAQIKTEARPND